MRTVRYYPHFSRISYLPVHKRIDRALFESLACTVRAPGGTFGRREKYVGDKQVWNRSRARGVAQYIKRLDCQTSFNVSPPISYLRPRSFEMSSSATTGFEVGSLPPKAPSIDVYDAKVAANEASDDVAAAYAGQLEGENAWTRKEQVRLRWKIDLRLIAILWFNVTLGAIDKVTTATGAVYGMLDDCNLTGNRYSWVGSIFCVSQLGHVAQHSSD